MTLDPWINIAPMEGVMDWRLRERLTQLGSIRRAATEFIRVTDQLLPPSVFYRHCPELKNAGKTSSGVPVFIQLLGGQAEPLADNAAQAAALGAPGIDLNFGCPAKTVNRHDGGATLLKSPKRLFDIVSAVRRSTPEFIPVTAKVRLGFDHKDFSLEIARAAAEGGAESLTVHARTKIEMYQPPAHWEFIARMREVVPIPVVANGDIWSVKDYLRCREITGCEAVALGRGLVARPDLARQIAMTLNDEPIQQLKWPEIQNLLFDFFEQQAIESERLALARTKQWCKFLALTYPEALHFFNQIKSCVSYDTMLSAFQKESIWPKSLSTPGRFAPIVSEPRTC